MTPEDLSNRFNYHPPKTDEKRQSHEQVRQELREVAYWLTGVLPEGREHSLAVTKLEEAMFWANAALARTP